MDIEAVEPTPEERRAWLVERRRGLGSTDAPAVARCSPWKSPLHVYLDKTGQLPLDTDDTPQLKRGRILEPLVAKMYSEEYGRPVRRPASRIQWHRELPHLFCSCDFLTTVDGESRDLEIKTAADRQGWGPPGSDEVPLQYYCQVQDQLMVTGLRLADLAVLFPDLELRVYTIPRNQAVIDRLIGMLTDFWRRIESREQPALDWSHPKTEELVGAMYGIKPGLHMELNQITEQLARQYFGLGKQVAELDRQRVRVKALLLAQMEESESASAPAWNGQPGVRVTRSRRHRDGYSVEPTEYIELRVKETKF